MARRLSSYNFDNRERQPEVNYPWELWTDGTIWKLRRNQDYFQSSHSFTSTLYAKARKLGMKVRTDIVEDSRGEAIVFQFSKRG